MYAKERKTTKPHNSSVALSATAPAAALVLASTQRLTRSYGLSFCVLRREKNGGVLCTPLQEAFSATDVDAVMRQEGLKVSRNSVLLRRYADEWSRRWTQLPSEPQQQPQQPEQPHERKPKRFHTVPSLPDALHTFLASMGAASASESFSLIGGLMPAAGERSEGDSGSALSTASTPPVQPLTSLYINAIDAIADTTEDLSRQAKAACALRHQCETQGHKEEETNITEDSTTGSEDDLPQPSYRFFVLAPYAPYAALYAASNGVAATETEAATPSFCGGEACEILLVYRCPREAARVVGVPVPTENPEVWGRVQYQQVGDAERSGAATRVGSSDELFFIAQSVEDYLRLGTAFAWVYGWQLCYASHGPPPRSLPWLKLFAPGALSAAIAAAAVDVSPPH